MAGDVHEPGGNPEVNAGNTPSPLGLSHRQAAFLADRTARATEQVAERTPTGLESFARSTLSTATAIVLAGVVLILVADVVNLVDGINIWPLISIAIAIAAVALGIGFAGWRERVATLAREATAPWALEQRFDGLEAKIDDLQRALPQPPPAP